MIEKVRLKLKKPPYVRNYFCQAVATRSWYHSVSVTSYLPNVTAFRNFAILHACFAPAKPHLPVMLGVPSLSIIDGAEFLDPAV